MYAKGAQLGTIKGEEILRFWGREIRDAFKNDTRTIVYKTTSLSTDGEYLAELGTYDVQHSDGQSAYKGKYLLVWKQEDGTWKLYKDMGL